MERCRHSGTWLIGGGFYEWCYECGAFRTMAKTGAASLSPDSPWAYPKGPGPNPWDDWLRRREAYRKRMATRRAHHVEPQEG